MACARRLSSSWLRVSSGASAVVLANDASFSANLTTRPLSELACTQESVDDVTWDTCDVPGWDLLAGSAVDEDTVRTVFVRFVDAFDYESEVFSAATMILMSDVRARIRLNEASVAIETRPSADEVTLSRMNLSLRRLASLK